VLPLVTTAGMEVTIAEEFEGFRQEAGGCESCIAVIDHRGLCVWSSAESLGPHLTTIESVPTLEQALMGVIGTNESGDVAMGDV
jgi:hypothetical protein